MRRLGTWGILLAMAASGISCTERGGGAWPSPQLIGRANERAVRIHVVNRADHGGEGSEASGSGCIVAPGGWILTNYHVIAHAARVRVYCQEGKAIPAEVVAIDPLVDLAVLRAAGLTQAAGDEVAWCRQVSVGTPVVCCGSPLQSAQHHLVRADHGRRTEDAGPLGPLPADGLRGFPRGQRGGVARRPRPHRGPADPPGDGQPQHRLCRAGGVLSGDAAAGDGRRGAVLQLDGPGDGAAPPRRQPCRRTGRHASARGLAGPAGGTALAAWSARSTARTRLRATTGATWCTHTLAAGRCDWRQTDGPTGRREYAIEPTFVPYTFPYEFAVPDKGVKVRYTNPYDQAATAASPSGPKLLVTEVLDPARAKGRTVGDFLDCSEVQHE